MPGEFVSLYSTVVFDVVEDLGNLIELENGDAPDEELNWLILRPVVETSAERPCCMLVEAGSPIEEDTSDIGSLGV